MSRKLSSSDFFGRCVKAHKGKYKYPVRNYKKPDSIITVICPRHGAFKIKARNHLWIEQGCNACFEASRGLTKRIDWTLFITAARKKHGLRYQYSRRSYSMMSEKVKIKCAEHGWFFQKGNKHLAGQGCEKCVHQAQRGKWHSSSLQKKSLGLPAAFYYMKFQKRNQVFYKIGITNDIERRTAVLKRESGFNVQVIYAWESNLRSAMKLEEKVQREFKDFSFKPPNQFPGYTECYGADILGLDL